MGSLKPKKEIIYESPDNGGTVYGRYAGSNERWIVGYSQEKKSVVDQIQEDKLWGEIRRAAITNEALKTILEKAKELYYLSKK